MSTEAGPLEIYVPSIDILEKLNVVNSGFTKPKWTMDSNGGVVYLKGERDTVYGINKYILACNTSKMILHVVFDPQRRDSWVLSAQAHSLVIKTPISPVMKVITNGWFNADYFLSPEQVNLIRRAKTLGLIVQGAYGAPVFLGFNRLPFGDGAAKLDGLMNSCGIGAAHASPCFVEDQRLTLRGIASSAWDEGEGQPGHKVVNLALDKPICFANAPSPAEKVVGVYPLPRGPFPRRITVIGCMVAGDGWTIDTSCKK